MSEEFQTGGRVHLEAPESGGQVLRTALSLSLLTGRPFQLSHIRARKTPPGLRAQHLACIRAVEAISEGRAEGAELGATELEFRPGPVRPGNYLLEMGPGASGPLLLQTLFYPLALAGGGTLTLRGGTHVPHAPSFHYLAWAWLPAIGIYGLGAELALTYAGFPPEGAGEITAKVLPPAAAPESVELMSRGALRDVHVTSMVGGLPFEEAEKAARTAAHLLREHGVLVEVEKRVLPVTQSGGAALLIRAEFERSIAAFSATGERGGSAEALGEQASRAFASFLEGDGAIEAHQADQLLLPAALLAAGRLGLHGAPAAPPGRTRFHASAITAHLTQNAAIIERFLPVRIALEADGKVSVTPSAAT